MSHEVSYSYCYGHERDMWHISDLADSFDEAIQKAIQMMQTEPSIDKAFIDGIGYRYSNLKQTMKTQELIKASIHLFFPTQDEAKREAYRTGSPYFRTYIAGVEMWTVRPSSNHIKIK